MAGDNVLGLQGTHTSVNAAQFIQKWRGHELSERSAAQQHFCDLCELVDHPKPAEADSTGEEFTFEKLTEKHSGSHGWADVWKKGCFAWEYKGPERDLDDAYDQLLEYREALENPPLLIVSDTERIEVHTNFTATPTEIHEVELNELGDPRSLEILRAVFRDPEKLRPGSTSESITTEAAQRIGEIAGNMRERGLDSEEVAHFLDRIVFCLFAEDIDLLPEQVFSRLLSKSDGEPEKFREFVGDLFQTMADGGKFAMEEIRHFNGNLFVDGPVLEMTADEIDRVKQAARLDWSAVDPSIFGTLFERGMDPGKRAQIGAHYTSREDIETLIDPVVMWPLERKWEETRETVDNLMRTGRKSGEERDKPMTKSVRTRSRNEAERLLRRFHERLTQVKVLDPACGSGNFLYVTLQKLKDLEKEVILFADEKGLSGIIPMVGPWQLYGIEVSPYAYDLAQMVVWIGYLQWVKANGFGISSDPVLRPMEGNFQNKDAILDLSDPDNPKEPEWPKVDYIVGNPPFLGDKLMRGALGDDYVENLRQLYRRRVPGRADLCCYWFEKANVHIQDGQCKRAGLLATQGIRGGGNRKVLEKIKECGGIFFAESDRSWILDGANVHVSMVAFDDGTEECRILDGKLVEDINCNLTGAADITKAEALRERATLAFLGSCKGGSFDIDEEEALFLLKSGGNPHSRPNSDIIRPLVNSQDLLSRRKQRWIIDNHDLSLKKAAQYEKPHEIVEERVKPARDENRDEWLRENWWRPQRMRPEMRSAIRPLDRFFVTPTTSKHRIFIWLEHPILPDHQLVVFARSDEYFFGTLHSIMHESWARAQGTQLREAESGFRYTPTTCFKTFPFPWPPGEEPEGDPLVENIAGAARELNELRENWLNPPEWTMTETLEFPGSVDGPWSRYVEDPDDRGIGTVRYDRTVADPPFADALKKRTLTNLYNKQPTWLQNAHAKLDEAVCAAYRQTTGDEEWTPDMDDEQILEKLLELNLQRASEQTD